MDFVFTESTKGYEEVLNTRMKDTHCKHVMRLSSTKASQFYAESLRIGNEKVMWGYGSGLYRNEGANRIVQLHTIGRMIYKNFDRPFRVVIDETGTIWADNLHCCIRDIMKNGEDAVFGDARIYIVDMSKPIPVIVSINKTVSDSLNDIRGSIEVAKKRCSRVNDRIREINYTIEDFLHDNNIHRGTLYADGTIFNG